MSKASERTKALTALRSAVYEAEHSVDYWCQGTPRHPTQPQADARVSSDGHIDINQGDQVIRLCGSDAASLAKWLIDTFGEPTGGPDR